MSHLADGDPQHRFAALPDAQVAGLSLADTVAVLWPGWTVVGMGMHRLCYLVVLNRDDDWLVALPHRSDAHNWDRLTPGAKKVVVSVMFRDDRVFVADNLSALIALLADRSGSTWSEELLAVEFLLSLSAAETETARALIALGGLGDVGARLDQMQADLDRLHADLRSQQATQTARATVHPREGRLQSRVISP